MLRALVNVSRCEFVCLCLLFKKKKKRLNFAFKRLVCVYHMAMLIVVHKKLQRIK